MATIYTIHMYMIAFKVKWKWKPLPESNKRAAAHQHYIYHPYMPEGSKNIYTREKKGKNLEIFH